MQNVNEWMAGWMFGAHLSLSIIIKDFFVLFSVLLLNWYLNGNWSELKRKKKKINNCNTFSMCIWSN